MLPLAEAYLRKAAADGVPLAEMASMLAVSKSTVWRRLRALGLVVARRGVGRVLVENEVIAIRAKWATGAVRQGALALEYGVSRQTINKIVNGRSRKNG